MDADYIKKLSKLINENIDDSHGANSPSQLASQVMAAGTPSQVASQYFMGKSPSQVFSQIFLQHGWDTDSSPLEATEKALDLIVARLPGLVEPALVQKTKAFIRSYYSLGQDQAPQPPAPPAGPVGPGPVGPVDIGPDADDYT